VRPDPHPAVEGFTPLNAEVRRTRNPNRRVIHITCSVHGGPRGFTDLVATKREGLIELDLHVTGGCVIILDEAATELFDALG
jgi:hypothetical protein